MKMKFWVKVGSVVPRTSTESAPVNVLFFFQESNTVRVREPSDIDESCFIVRYLGNETLFESLLHRGMQYTSRDVRKRTIWHMRPTKTQISLRIRAVWLQSSFSASRNFKSLSILIAPREDFDQTTRTRRLIWIFAGRNIPKLPL